MEHDPESDIKFEEFQYLSQLDFRDALGEARDPVKMESVSFDISSPGYQCEFKVFVVFYFQVI